METFHVAPDKPGGGYWTIDRDFLGTERQDNRTMHYALVLPTRQVLVINGGNYDFYGAVHYPVMLTPVYKDNKFVEYRKERMADAVEPRLYHNTAVLLPDASILISGGNTSRATVTPSVIPPGNASQLVQPKPDLSKIDLNTYFYGDGPIARGQKGMLTTPTENWVAEIYQPPYLFIDGTRRAKIHGLTSRAQHTFTKRLGGQDYYLLHSGQSVQLSLQALPHKCTAGARESLSLIKLPSVTHGWDGGQQFVDLPFTGGPGAPGGAHSKVIQFTAPDAKASNIPPGYYMLFYVDCMGKPSKAQMVRFDDQANAP